MSEQRRKDSPLVSVLMPLYNHGSYVGSALDSIYRDSYPTKEVLILDDGSTDESYAAVERWRAKHPQAFSRFLLLQQANRGITATMNTLVELARGEFIVPLASDDLLVAGGVDARVHALRDHPEWMGVIGDCIVVDETGKDQYSSGFEALYNADKKALLDPARIAAELIWRWSIPGPVIMVRRSAFDPSIGIGPYNEQLIVEDRDFYLRLLARNALGFIDTKVGAYRRHSSNSVATTNNQRKLALRSCEYEVDRAHLSSFGGFQKLGIWINARATRAEMRLLSRGRTYDWLKFASLKGVQWTLYWCFRLAAPYRRSIARR